MARINLTDRFLKSLKPAAAGRRDEWMDAIVPGFGVRITEKGQKTFILVARYPGSKNPTRRSVGEVGVISLVEARQKVRVWLVLIKKGIDPKTAEERERQAELRRQRYTFESVAEEFIKKHVSKLRTGNDIARDLRREFVSRWGSRPIADIDRHDVLSVIEAAVDRGAPHQARNLLAHIRKLFGWAISRGAYGIDHTPCSLLKPADIVGKPPIRQRILTEGEWRAFWQATLEMGYPFGDLFRALALTGCRRDELASAKWSEIDFEKKVLNLSSDRMKSDAAHVLPLSYHVISLLEGLPQVGEYLFTTLGSTPVSGFSKAKRQIDGLMVAALRTRAQKPEAIKLAPWRIHDLRRSMRTGLSALGVQDRIAEMTIGHKVQGLHKIYDLHSYFNERRDALARWEAHLLGIVKSQPENVVLLHLQRAQ